MVFGHPPWAIRGGAGAWGYFAAIFFAIGLFIFYTMWQWDEPWGCVFALMPISLGAFVMLIAALMYAGADRTPIAIDDGAVILNGPFKPTKILIAKIKAVHFNDEAVWFSLRNYKEFTIDRCHFWDAAEMLQFVEAVQERIASTEPS